MIPRADITPEEFDRRRDRLRSRWSSLIRSLKAGAVGDVFPIFLRAEENTAKARRLACQSIRAIVRHHRLMDPAVYDFSVRISCSPLGILVMKCADPEPMMVGSPGVDPAQRDSSKLPLPL